MKRVGMKVAFSWLLMAAFITVEGAEPVTPATAAGQPALSNDYDVLPPAVPPRFTGRIGKVFFGLILVCSFLPAKKILWPPPLT